MKPDQYKYGMPVTQGKILAKGRQYVKKVTEKQAALGISAEAVAAVVTAQDNAEASHLVTTEKEHARPVDYRYNDECFGILENLLADIQRRFFKIPPCTQEDLDDVGIVTKVNRNLPYGIPKGTCTLTAEHPGPSEMRFRSHIRKGGIPDEEGGVVGRAWQYGLRDTAVAQLTVEEMTNEVFTNGASLILKRPLTDAGKTIDISVALKNGSEQPGSWSPVQSFVLS